jgi:hypothetical protein
MKGWNIEHYYATAPRAALNAPWREQAVCAGRDMEGVGRRAEAAAKRVCRSCPVLAACHAWVTDLPGALDPGGICAATTERERIALRKRRTLADTLARQAAERGAA